MELIGAIVLGVIEGVTEWLPVSSTGHMILVDEILHLDVSEEFFELFLVVIQLGAICAVPTVFKDRIFPRGILIQKEARAKWISLWINVALATLPATVMGLLFELSGLQSYLDNSFAVALSLIAYGVIFIVISIKKRGRDIKVRDCELLSTTDALGLGCFQILSLIPGTSRSGSVFLGGEIMGIHREASAEFSFLMAMPIILGASLFKTVKFFMSANTITLQETAVLLVGMLVAFFVSVISIRFLMDFVRGHTLVPFGIYRIALGLLVLFNLYK